MYMQKMARTWPEPIVQQPAAQLPWGHVTVLMDKLETRSELDFYATEAVRNGWSAPCWTASSTRACTAPRAPRPPMSR
ncbi:DUF1016 N-terminal domain-containing protein [Streptomyces sp. NPDC001348]